MFKADGYSPGLDQFQRSVDEHQMEIDKIFANADSDSRESQLFQLAIELKEILGSSDSPMRATAEKILQKLSQEHKITEEEKFEAFNAAFAYSAKAREVREAYLPKNLINGEVDFEQLQADLKQWGIKDEKMLESAVRSTADLIEKDREKLVGHLSDNRDVAKRIANAQQPEN